MSKRMPTHDHKNSIAHCPECGEQIDLAMFGMISKENVLACPECDASVQVRTLSLADV